jgi:hypothetical protein
MTHSNTRLPPGWDETRVQRVSGHSESQTEDEAIAEDEAAFTDPAYAVMLIPRDLVPAVRTLLANSDR